MAYSTNNPGLVTIDLDLGDPDPTGYTVIARLSSARMGDRVAARPNRALRRLMERDSGAWQRAVRAWQEAEGLHPMEYSIEACRDCGEVAPTDEDGLCAGRG